MSENLTPYNGFVFAYFKEYFFSCICWDLLNVTIFVACLVEFTVTLRNNNYNFTYLNLSLVYLILGWVEIGLVWVGSLSKWLGWLGLGWVGLGTGQFGSVLVRLG